jgi:type IV pilus assembly protein PilC
MAHFQYQALNADQQRVAGKLHAESVAAAVAQLEASGLTVQAIGYATSDADSNENTPTLERTASDAPFRDAAPGGLSVEQVALQQHMEWVIQRGQAIVPALRAYAEETTSGFRRQQLLAVLEILNRQDAVQAAIAVRALPAYWIPLLGAAATARDPGRILREFLSESQRAEDLRRQWFLTLAYPLAVAGVAVAVMTALSFLVIPVFREIFMGFGLKLPPLTQFVFTIAEWITSGRILLATTLAIALGALALWLVRLLPASVRDSLSDRFGTPLGRSTALARFSQFAADLFEAELEVPNVLRLAGFATDSARLRRAAWRLASEIEAGGEIAVAKYRHLLTATVVHALRLETPTASRIRLLREVSGCYTQRAWLHFSWTRGLIEPIAVCLVGIVVGGTTIALFLPLMSLIQGLS